jgi:peptidoglycan hydrolase-like protein with peptidoglycan-binding domain
MARNRIVVLSGVLAAISLAAAGAWVAGSRIESPADAAARTEAPTPSPILVPVEKRVLGSNIVTRGTARFGLPQPISVAPSILKAQLGLITTLPIRNTQFSEGSVLLTSSGRPVFVFQGKLPAYRDLTPGIRGEDVRQLEQALKRLGFDPGQIDGVYDQNTGAAVNKWYQSKGSEPFGPTREHLALVRTLEREWSDAVKVQEATAAVALAAVPAVESARALALHNNRTVSVDLATKTTERQRLEQSLRADTGLSIEDERAKSVYANAAAEAELAAAISERAFIELDPRQPDTARAATNAKLEVARAAAHRTKIAGQISIQAAERASKAVDERLKQAEVNEASARLAQRSMSLEGEKNVRTAVDALRLAELDAKQARDRANQLAADLDKARNKLGIQVPVDELVFIPSLPVRVEELKAVVGGPATGTVMTVTNNQLSIDSSVTLDSAPMIKPGMPVSIDEQALGVKARGVVLSVASTPGTRGVDGLHFYFEIKVDPTPARLEGFSVRVTIPIKSTQGAVIAIPNSALSLAADGSSRVQVSRNNALEYIVVRPGLAADGYVEVTPVGAKLEPGELVVVGYNNPKAIESTAKSAESEPSVAVQKQNPKDNDSKMRNPK